MSKSEDYLDHLLNGMSGGAGMDMGMMEPAEAAEQKSAGNTEDDFLKSFADEMLDSNGADDFLREFEQELMGSEIGSYEPQREESGLTDDLDGLISGMKDHMQSEDDTDVSEEPLFMEPEMTMPEETLDDFIVNTMDEEILEDIAMPEISSMPEMTATTGELEGGEDDLMALLHADSDFSDIGSGMSAEGEKTEISEADLFADFGDTSIDGFADIMGGALDASLGLSADVPEAQSEEETDKKSKKKQKKENTGEGGGFFAKLGKLLFGEDEEEEEKAQPEKIPIPSTVTSIEELSDENLALLKEFGEISPAAPEPEKEEAPKKEKKKKEKKEKKEKKPKKEKAPKPKKVKKPKAPKVPDNTPPLPKVPVFLTFVMAASILALVILGTDLLGYSGSFSNAKRAYERAEYSEAFRQVSGVEVKDADFELYEKYRIMALVSSEYEAYESMMQAEFYDMALDSLVRAAGRSDKYHADAAVYGCTSELDKLNARITEELTATFGLSQEDALELYAYRDREEYSVQIYEILEKTGMKKVAEE